MANTPTYVNVDPRLDAMFKAQADLQRRILGMDPSQLSDVDKMAYIREQALAMISEINEALGETGWKSWASSNHINRDAYVSELGADAMRFLINMLLVVNATPVELFKTFMSKVDMVNARVGNYDGVSTKCPRCHRDRGDKGVECYAWTPPSGAPSVQRFWCDQFKGWYSDNGLAVVV